MPVEAPRAEPRETRAHPSTGRALREARAARRLSLEEVSEQLRIEPQFLVALEEERYAEIGPPVFVKGYLKHYCELLGLDPRPLLAAYRAGLAREEPVPQPRLSIGPERERPLGAWLAAAAAAVLIAAAFWQVGRQLDGPGEGTKRVSVPLPREGSQSLAEAGEQAALVSAPEPPRVPSPRTASDGDEPRGPAAQPPSEEAVAGEVPLQTGALPLQTGAPPLSRPPADASEESLAAAPEAARSEQAGSARESGSETAVEIELTFLEDAWTEVTDGADQRLFYGLARAGAARRIVGSPPVRVLIGNADGVSVSVNGEPFAYPPGSRRGELARFTLHAPAE